MQIGKIISLHSRHHGLSSLKPGVNKLCINSPQTVHTAVINIVITVTRRNATSDLQNYDYAGQVSLCVNLTVWVAKRKRQQPTPVLYQLPTPVPCHSCFGKLQTTLWQRLSWKANNCSPKKSKPTTDPMCTIQTNHYKPTTANSCSCCK